MFSTRWRKVVRELWSNRTRTMLVIASIAVGIFAVGTVQLLRSVILSELKVIYAETNVAQAVIFTNGVDQDQLDAIGRMREVADVQGRSSLPLKVQTKPDKQETLLVTSIDDFNDIRINRIQPIYSLPSKPAVGAERTTWPQKDEIVIERSGFNSATTLPAGLAVGDKLALQNQDDRPRGDALGRRLRSQRFLGQLHRPGDRVCRRGHL